MKGYIETLLRVMRGSHKGIEIIDVGVARIEAPQLDHVATLGVKIDDMVDAAMANLKSTPVECVSALTADQTIRTVASREVVIAFTPTK